MNSNRLIRLPEVLEQVGVSERTLHRKVKAGTFPKPITICWDSLGRPRINVWRQQEVIAWSNSLGAKV